MSCDAIVISGAGGVFTAAMNLGRRLVALSAGWVYEHDELCTRYLQVEGNGKSHDGTRGCSWLAAKVRNQTDVWAWNLGLVPDAASTHARHNHATALGETVSLQ